MSESLSEPELQPGAIIEFSDFNELPAFEDAVARSIDPDMDPATDYAWQRREPLKDLVRPPKYNGRMINIRLEVMAEPYLRLLDARERGWKFHRSSSNFELSSEFAEQQIPLYHGFIFSADAWSSGRGIVDQIHAEIYLLPVPVHFNKTTQQIQKMRGSYGGNSVIRRVTKPLKEPIKFLEIDKNARETGLAVRRTNILRPISSINNSRDFDS